MPRTNPEVVAVLQRDLFYVSMPEALRELILADRTSVVITGTHGKTTTTSLTAWLLEAAGMEPGFLIGGTPGNFPRGFRLGEGRPFVIEGDEYNTAFFDRDAKFLHYAPTVAVVTHLEFDHGDIYPDLAAIESQFERLVREVPAGDEGQVVACADAPHVAALMGRLRPDARTYGLGSEARLRATDLRADSEGTTFRLHDDGAFLGEVRLAMHGRHNVQNSLAAIAVGLHLGARLDDLAGGLASFLGVRRRLEERGTVAGVTVIDDFAHHPTAIGETLAAAAQRYPGRPIHVLFEPRSLTSGRGMFADAYMEALGSADRVSFAPVFHQDRLPEAERLDFAQLATRLAQAGVAARAHTTMDSLVTGAVEEAVEGEVLLFMSSGSFSGAIEATLNQLQSGSC